VLLWLEARQPSYRLLSELFLRPVKSPPANATEMYNAQAEQAKIQGRSQAISYKQQGAMVLRNLNETLASTIALAGAGNVDPTSGSARVMQEFARAEAFAEYGTALDNAVLAKEGAAAQAQFTAWAVAQRSRRAL
jgi:hypothetical protein